MGNRIPKLQFCTHRRREKAISVGALPLSWTLRTENNDFKITFFSFTGHITYNKEDHDMTQYLWTEILIFKSG